MRRGLCFSAPPSARGLAISLMSTCAFYLASTVPAAAQEYPSRPIKIVVGLAAGGASDTLARLIGKKLGERLGQPVVVENRPGAGGNIASEYVAKAPADGYTVLYTADNHTLNPLIYSSVNYDPQRDFTGVVLVSKYSLVLSANSSSRYKSIFDLLNHAQKTSDAIFYGSSGIGLPNHIAMEKFNKAAGTKIAHVAYKGSSQSVMDAASGQIPLVMSTITAALPFIESHKLIPLAVTGETRWPTLPDVPTLAEAGFPDAVSLSWMGIVAPSATPVSVIEKLNNEIQEILEERDTKDQFFKMGMGVGGGTPDEFNGFLEKDMQASRQIVEAIELKID